MVNDTTNVTTGLFKSDAQSALAQATDQMKSLKNEVAVLRSNNNRLKNDVIELHTTLETVYNHQNVHGFPASLRDRISRVLIENKPD